MLDLASTIAIVSLAVTPLLNSEAGKASIGKVAEKLTEETLKKMGRLWTLIHNKLQSKKLPEVDVAIAKAKQGDQSGIDDVAEYLGQVMAADKTFAAEVQRLTQEIHREIQIQQGTGSKVYNVFGGKVEENTFTDNKAPILKDNTGTVNITYGSLPPQS